MSSLNLGLTDLLESLRSWRLWTLLGWLEIRQRYSRSKLGPLWLTISMGIMVGTLGIVYGTLFGQPLENYLPLLAGGIVIWNLFSTSVSEGSLAYIASGHYIRQVRTPRLIYVLQVLWRNSVIFGHNLIIIVVVVLFFGVKSWTALPLFIPGFLLLLANAFWIAALTGLLSARFRDLPQIVSALLQVTFYITPILFSGDMLRGKHHWVVEYNPIAYIIDVMRQPLMGVVPEPATWIISAAMALAGSLFALMMTGRYHKRIPYWA